MILFVNSAEKIFCDPSSETVQTRGHNRFYAELTKSIPNYQQIPPII